MEPDAKRPRTNSYDYGSPHHHHQQHPPQVPSQYQQQQPPPPPPQPHQHRPSHHPPHSSHHHHPSPTHSQKPQPHQDPHIGPPSAGQKYSAPHTPTGPPPPHAPAQTAPPPPPPSQHDRHMHDPNAHGHPPHHHPGYGSGPRHGDPYAAHTPTTPTVATEHHHQPSHPSSAYPHHPQQPYPPQPSHLTHPPDHETRREHPETGPYHYSQQHALEQTPNGNHSAGPPIPPVPPHMAGPQGMPQGPAYVNAPTSSAGPHMAHHQQYENGYTMASGMASSQITQHVRRKAVRAAQACDNCRQKKAKCDEQRPSCTNCIQTGVQCNYRDVPAPKQDKTIAQLTDQVQANKQGLEDLHNTLITEMRSLRNDLLSELQNHRSQSNALEVSTPALMPQRQASGGPGAYGKQTTPKDMHQYQRNAKQADDPYKIPPPTPSHRAGGDEQSSMDVLQGELAIPVEHTTAAHKLLTEWPTIKPFFESITDRSYVSRDEQQRPHLALFDEKPNIAKGLPTPADSPTACTINPPRNVARSKNLNASFANLPVVVMSITDVHRAPPGPGGLFADGSVCVDTSTCWRLLASYLKNMHIFHPILHKEHITGLVEKFIAEYSPTPFFANPHRSSSASTSDLQSRLKPESPFDINTGSKRKRVDEFDNERGDGSREEHVDRVIIERTMDNILVLLVLALGRICEHTAPLPPSLDDEERLRDTDYQWGDSDLPTPGPGVWPPPASSPGKSSAGNWARQGMSKRSTAELQQEAAAREKVLQTKSNMERVPGLAYYAYACAILGGDNNGRSELATVHAYLLCGLYMGQLARVFESWSWINRACTMCEVLWKRHEADDEDDVDGNAIKMAFWSCLQLESDILAELDLPHSGISRLEDTVSLPRLKVKDPELETLIMYYLAQVHLRKVLNRAHSALYNSGNNKMRNKGWSVLNANDLALQLDRWRSLLPPQLAWDDDDEPPEDINAARLRAKYWGAQYIIHRPFLHKVVSGYIIPEDSNGGSHSSSPAGHADLIRSDSWSNRGAESDKSADIQERVLHNERAKLFQSCLKCVAAAKASTVAFDNVKTMPRRLVVTNIFGTAQAQFGNLLVLAATNRNPAYRWLVPTHVLTHLLQRTIDFLNYLAPISPTMQTDVRILQNIQRIVEQDPGERAPSVSTSFGGS